MITTIPAEDILGIVHSTPGNPHAVLGMHKVEVLGKKVPVVRVFAPRARDIVVVEKDSREREYPMEQVHPEGLFEAICFKRKKKFPYVLRLTDHEGTVRTSEDPYVYPDAVTAFDRYLFKRAVHYEIYDKMGAHLRTVDGVDGVQFSVWAPYARRVSVVGDFNRWDGRQHPLKLHTDSGVWELFVPGIGAGEIYKYEIKAPGDEVFLKTDPYGQQFELRPKTGSIVTRGTGYPWEDARWLERRGRTEWQHEPILITKSTPGRGGAT